LHNWGIQLMCRSTLYIVCPCASISSITATIISTS
jgi:hypothetical protein